MKRSTFTEVQIAFAIKQAETGARVEEVRRKMVRGLIDTTRMCSFPRRSIDGPMSSRWN